MNNKNHQRFGLFQISTAEQSSKHTLWTNAYTFTQENMDEIKNAFIFDVFLYICMYLLTFYKSIYFPLNVTQRVPMLHKQLYIETSCMNN